MNLSSPSVVVSIATIPSRIGKLRPTLESLLNGSLVPEEILVVHPNFCEWESSGYDRPNFLADPVFCRGVIRNVISSRDWGPGTKLLGAVDVLPAESILVLADDDIVYHRDFLRDLVAAQIQDRRSSFSYYTYRSGGLPIGQGCDGFSFWSNNLIGVQAFARNHVAGTTLLYHDDLWISFFLFRKGVKIKKVPLPPETQLIYEQVLPNDILSSATSGDFARETIFRTSLPRLVKKSGLPFTKRILLRFWDTYDFIDKKRLSLLRKLGPRQTR